jgi:hypothetical protein
MYRLHVAEAAGRLDHQRWPASPNGSALLAERTTPNITTPRRRP